MRKTLFTVVIALALASDAYWASGQYGAPPGYEAESAALRRLKEQARALARADGCPDSETCRAAPLGERPCGGPSGFIIYCRLTTDEPALRRKIAEVTQAEKAFNAKWQELSDCRLVSPPPLASTRETCGIDLRSLQPSPR